MSLKVAVFVSILFHIVGFFIVRVKALEAHPEQYIEVGFYDRYWSARRVNLPGSEDDDAIFRRNWSSELPQARLKSENKITTNIFNSKGLSRDAQAVPFYKWKPSPPKDETPRIEGPAARRAVIFEAMPEYPEWALSYGLEFDLKLKFWLSPNGEVNTVVVEHSSGYPEVDVDVVRVMRRWKFNSIEEKNRSVRQWGMITFKFRLERSLEGD